MIKTLFDTQYFTTFILNSENPIKTLLFISLTFLISLSIIVLSCIKLGNYLDRKVEK